MLTYRDLLFMGPEAVCVLDAELEIKQHNQLFSLLLGYRGGTLAGRHLSSILYDSDLIKNLLSPENDPGWIQGECILKMSTGRQLLAKFRASPIADEGLTSAHGDMMDIIYHPAENRFLPFSGRLSEGVREKPATGEPKGYVFVFRESEESLYASYKRQLSSFRFLLNMISNHSMEVEDILLEFTKIFDPYAEAILLPPDFGKGDLDEHQFIMPPAAIEAALEAVRAGNVASHRDDNTWYFFSIHSRNRVHGIACIKFAIPRLHNEIDKDIFAMAGKVLGAYIETFTSGGQSAASQPLLETILSDIDYPVVVVDRNGCVTLCNPAAEKFYNYAASEMAGKSFGGLVFPVDSIIKYGDMLDQVLSGKSLHYEEMLHVSSDFTAVETSLSVYPHKLDSGLVAGAIFVMRSLREKRRLLEKMKQWEKSAALGEILSSVANELNNPLTSLTGYSHLLRNRDSDDDIDDMVLTIQEEAKRCSDIVNRVLDLARKSEDSKEKFYINDVIISTLNLKQRQLRPNNIDVGMNLGEGIPSILADPHDMERLFLRLINYAEKRMLEYENGGRLTVESTCEDGNIIIRFMDTGTCVLEGDMAEINDPFFIAQADEGVGLGLSISCQFLRNIGGSIRVEGEIGKGNVFTIELPAGKEITSDVTESKTTGGHDFALETGKRILVVDDEPTIVELLAEILQQMGHIADIAADGNEAMTKLDQESYDLIISDLRMPSGFTGDRLHKFIALKNPELAQRTIFITGDVINPETRSFLQSTGNLYLEKPFLPESLQAAIETSLNR